MPKSKSVRRSFVQRCWIGAMALGASLGVARSISAESRALPADIRPLEAVLIGSSSFNQDFGRIIERELGGMGYHVTRKAVSGAGLARPDFHDMTRELEALPISANTAAVFIYLGVNDAQAVWLHPHERGDQGLTSVPFGTEDWEMTYARRTREFLGRICERGARRAVVILPIDVNRADLQERLHRIRDVQERAASITTCAVTVQTAGDAGQFELSGVPKRMRDGFHMSMLGAQIVWERIQPEVLTLLAPSQVGPVVE
jgi:hypothetical protein